MKRAWSVMCTLGLVMLMATTAMADAVISQDVLAKKLNDEPAAKSGFVVDWNDAHNELDEIIGDTVIVGMSWRDMQHNSTLSRMIEVDDWVDDETTVHMTWCYRETASGTSQAYYISANLLDDGSIVVGTSSQANVGGEFGGYQVMTLASDHDMPVMTYHGGPPAGDEYHSYHAVPNPFVPNVWNTWTIPEVDIVTMWPHAVGAYDEDDNYYVHSLLNEYDPDNLLEDGLYYNRALLNPSVATFTNATPGGDDQVLVTDISMNLANALAVSDDGMNVAVANMVSRFHLYDEGENTQHNNEILIWESNDAGETWNWGAENAMIVTNWIAPDPSALPDTTAANGDTMRCYTEIDMVYDDDNNLHVTFNTENYYFYEGTISILGSRQWYWNSVDQLFVQIQEADYFNSSTAMDVAVWEKQVGNGNLYYDSDTGVIWCSFVMYGEDGLYEIQGEQAVPLDCSDDGIQATDVWITASPDMGKHWAKPINVTKTRNMSTNLGPGETESEREMTMALNSDGDWLHLFYTKDYDGGIASPGGDAPVGDPTNNPLVYHRVAKQALIDSFDVNAQWVRNYPLHRDSTDFYQDPDDWTTYPDDGFFGLTSVGEKNQSLTPDQFELQQNYPNPFNPSTQIAFNLSSPGKVKLAVYDVLGREVATLVNRGMSAGAHSVNFYAGDLASGVYFYKLSSGDQAVTRKMVLMK
ncbi:T9SS type A sorting domain-containing protein [bacterium]|nr:T9SS type A sorting domain-containing protein [bacterium]